MKKLPKKTYTPEFKAKVALAALSKLTTIDAVALQFKINKTQVVTWKKVLEDQSVNLFLRGTKGNVYDDRQSEIDTLQMTVGQLTMELNQLKKNLR